MRPRHVLPFVAALTLLLATPARADEADDLAAKALEAAKSLAASGLPTTADLGEGWKRPWEVPLGAPAGADGASGAGRRVTEAEWWQRFERENFPAGIPADHAKKMSDVFTQSGGGPAERQGLLFALQKIGEGSSTLADRLSMSAEVLIRMGTSTASRPLEMEALAAMEANAARFQGVEMAGLKDAFVQAATRLDERTRMQFLKSNDWAALATVKTDRDLARRKLWLGTVTVSLSILKLGREGEVKNLDKEAAAALEAKLSLGYAAVQRLVAPAALERAEKELQSLGGEKKRLEGPAPDGSTSADLARRGEQLVDVTAQIGEKQAEKLALGQPITVKVLPRDFGDNSYVVRVVAPAFSAAGRASIYTGWLRNGKALVEIEMTGNFPEAEMNKEMDHFLQELDAKTAIYRD